jgi:hypothetical protein
MIFPLVNRIIPVLFWLLFQHPILRIFDKSLPNIYINAIDMTQAHLPCNGGNRPPVLMRVPIRYR